jgi:hypothetical protein
MRVPYKNGTTINSIIHIKAWLAFTKHLQNGADDSYKAVMDCNLGTCLKGVADKHGNGTKKYGYDESNNLRGLDSEAPLRQPNPQTSALIMMCVYHHEWDILPSFKDGKVDPFARFYSQRGPHLRVPSDGQLTGSSIFVFIMLLLPQAGHFNSLVLPTWTNVGCHGYSKTTLHFSHFAFMEQSELMMNV